MTRPDSSFVGPDPAPSQGGINVTLNNADVNAQVAVPAPDPQQGSGGGGTVFEVSARSVPLTENEKWFKTYWRPAAAWMYLGINLFDFIVAPVITMILPKLIGSPYVPWNPLTLTNGGMFHVAFGAIIGVTAWGRTRERVSGLGPDAGG